jgi:hypothetical protein
MTLGDLHNVKCLSLYSQFTEWCSNIGYNKIMSNFTFKEDVSALYDIELRMVNNPGRAPSQVFYKPGEFDKDYKPF